MEALGVMKIYLNNGWGVICSDLFRFAETIVLDLKSGPAKVSRFPSPRGMNTKVPFHFHFELSRVGLKNRRSSMDLPG